MKFNHYIFGIVLVAGSLAACDNQDIEFDDYKFQAVYFGSQYPVRTLQLGDDEFMDLTLDNQHKFKIMATMGGTYNNNRNRVIDFVVDESLCANLFYADNDTPVLPMPKEYYQLASDQIVLPAGSELDGVEVKLTDAYFADEKALGRNYVIPLRMTGVQGADSILSGLAGVDNPDLCVASDWIKAPRNYVLYCVRYVNPWHAVYVRRGKDKITDATGTTTETIRHQEYVEKDEVVNVITAAYKKVRLPLTIKKDDGTDVNYELTLTFDDNNQCSVSAGADNLEVSGSGKFVMDGEKQSIGGLDRNALYLDYQVKFKELNRTYITTDTLVVRDRGVRPEYFSVKRVK